MNALARDLNHILLNVLDLDNSQARKYFLETRNYCNFELPEYFDFTRLLSKTSRLLEGSRLGDYYLNGFDPREITTVSHTIFSNKDGKYSWRPFQLVHPAIYVALVHTLTEYDNWELIRSRFRYFSGAFSTDCWSVPAVSYGSSGHKATQIKNWWEHVEQDSVKLALKFRHLTKTDISNFYPSIYTHTISWALHGKPVAKANRNNNTFLGNQIDVLLMSCNNRQTNGIPQGNAVSDFLGEILLGFIDKELDHKLSDEKPSLNDYHIIRFRDDYRIFTNNLEDSEIIVRALSITLSEYGLNLNSSKTESSDDVVLSSFKTDKLETLLHGNTKIHVPKSAINEDEINGNRLLFSKALVRIAYIIKRHPNSGSAKRLLDDFHESLLRFQKSGRELSSFDDATVMISIASNIAINNSSCVSWCMAIISILLRYCPTTEAKQATIFEIHKLVKRVTHSSMYDIWLQRITCKTPIEISYAEPITKVLTNKSYPGNHFWDSSWLSNRLRHEIVYTSIINQKTLDDMSDIIDRHETNLFQVKY